ncbi:hypothetical protein [Nocardia nepalensis]|uniref:hypothetical protein n=1 Tax=Nocardia nepalensis TaxID=3375448 RepID=UPI003B677FF0
MSRYWTPHQRDNVVVQVRHGGAGQPIGVAQKSIEIGWSERSSRLPDMSLGLFEHLDQLHSVAPGQSRLTFWPKYWNGVQDIVDGGVTGASQQAGEGADGVKITRVRPRHRQRDLQMFIELLVVD